ncbi:NADH-quinone oxidoreductase subunit NuoE [Nitrospira moscoviensis]|nr:NADH-quinone oxidoreductase subunit NuoE [Nitrospira moscoviensis]
MRAGEGTLRSLTMLGWSGKSEMLKEKYQKEIDEILSRYPVKRSALIPLLYLAQRDQGYVTESAMKEIARLLGLTPPQVYETATFYTMLNLKKVGRFHIQVCKSLMCALVGSDTVIDWIKTKLGIAPGESTADGLFTLSVVECLAACGTGPMMQINDDYYERLTEEKVDRILADLKTTGNSPLKSGPYMWPEPAAKPQ